MPDDMPAHTCTPRWWPHHLGDTWTCERCGHAWVVDTADHISADVVALGLLDPLTLGWRTA